MPRTRSIPQQYYPAIMNRFHLGWGGDRIVEWLAKKQVKTSRTSVLRLRDELLAERSEQSRISAVNRARSQACVAQEEFEAVGREFRQLLEDTHQPDLDREGRAVLALRAQMLAKMSVHLFRQLRGAGVVGAAADRAVEQWDEATQAIRKEVVAEEDASRGDSVPETVRFGGDKPAESRPNDSVTVSGAPPEEAPPAVRQAYEAGLAQAPCPVTAPRHPLTDDGIPETPELPLTPEEQAYASGYALTWAGQLREKDPSSPVDEARLLERTIAEVQFQKELLRLRQFDRDVRERLQPDDLPAAPETLSGTATLAPETAVPEPWATERAQREAYRAGLAGLSPRLHLPEDPPPGSPLAEPLTPTELAWCAGRAAQLASAGTSPQNAPLTLEEWFAGAQEELQFDKWRVHRRVHGGASEETSPKTRRKMSVAALDAWAPARAAS